MLLPVASLLDWRPPAFALQTCHCITDVVHPVDTQISSCLAMASPIDEQTSICSNLQHESIQMLDADKGTACDQVEDWRCQQHSTVSDMRRGGGAYLTTYLW